MSKLHTYVYIYIYIERENDRKDKILVAPKPPSLLQGAAYHVEAKLPESLWLRRVREGLDDGLRGPQAGGTSAGRQEVGRRCPRKNLRGLPLNPTLHDDSR